MSDKDSPKATKAKTRPAPKPKPIGRPTVRQIRALRSDVETLKDLLKQANEATHQARVAECRAVGRLLRNGFICLAIGLAAGAGAAVALMSGGG